MAFRLFVLAAVLAVVALPAAAQHHDAPAAHGAKGAPEAGKAAPKSKDAHAPAAKSAAAAHDAQPAHGAKSGVMLGQIAPVAPVIAPGDHAPRPKRAAKPAEPATHGDEAPAEPLATRGRRKADLAKGSSPADVAASINQRLAELAELRKTAPTALRRPAAPKPAATPEAALPVAKVIEPPRPVIKLRWRVPVTWPEDLLAGIQPPAAHD